MKTNTKMLRSFPEDGEVSRSFLFTVNALDFGAPEQFYQFTLTS